MYQIVLYTNGDGETLTFQFNGGRGVVNLEETMTFITDKTVGSANSPFIFSGVAAPPSSAPRSFNPADYEKSLTLVALITINGVDQASGTLTAFASTEVRGVLATPTRPPFGPYTNKMLYHMIVYANGDGETISFLFDHGSRHGSGVFASRAACVYVCACTCACVRAFVRVRVCACARVRVWGAGGVHAPPRMPPPSCPPPARPGQRS